MQDNEVDTVKHEQPDRIAQGIQFQYESPLPPASEMQRYQNINPNIPEIIMKEFESNSAHVRKQEERVLEASIADNKRGQYLAFGISLAILAVVGLSLSLGNTTFAGVSGLAFIAYMIVGIFVKTK